MDLTIFNITIVNALFWVFVTWHYALRCGFISDDHAVIAQRTDIIPDAEKKPKNEDYWIKVFNDGVVMYFINSIMFKLPFRRMPFMWHLLSLTLHILNVFLLYTFLSGITTNEIAVIVSLFWGINPMLNQNVVWISGRPYLIATTLILVGMIYFNLPYVFIPLYILAVITNISIALVPILLKMIYPDNWQPNLYIWILAVAAVPFIVWKFKRRFSGALIIDRDNFRFKKRRFNVLVRLVAYYVWTFFAPIRMGWYHQVGFKYNKVWEKFNIWTLAGYGITAALLTQGISGWWVILGLLPNMNVFATNSFVQDRYIYFGSIGISMISAPYLLKYPQILIVVCAFYVIRSYMYSRQMQNDEALYRENWRNHKRSDFAVNNLSFFLIQQHRYEEARTVIERGLAINRNNKMLWYNLGVTWAATGNLKNDEGKFKFLRAIDCWKMALQIEPRWTKPAEDMQKLTEFLLKYKVITINKNEAAPGELTVDIPSMGRVGKK